MSRRWARRPWGAVRFGAMGAAALAVASVAVFSRGNQAGLSLAVIGGAVTGVVVALRVLGERVPEESGDSPAPRLGESRVRRMLPDALWAGVVWVVLSLAVALFTGATDPWGLLAAIATTPLWAVGVCVGAVIGVWLWGALAFSLDRGPRRVSPGWALAAGILVLVLIFAVCAAATAPALAAAVGRPGDDLVVIIDVLFADVTGLAPAAQIGAWIARVAALLIVVLLVWAGIRRVLRPSARRTPA